MPATAARRAARAQPRSVSASVGTSRGRCAATTATDAPARSSDPASAASATRHPWVEPSDTRRTSTLTARHPARLVTGTLINVGAVLLGTLIGTLAGARLPERVHQRVLFGLGMVTLILGVDNAL